MHTERAFQRLTQPLLLTPLLEVKTTSILLCQIKFYLILYQASKHLFIHLFDKYLSAYSVPCTVLKCWGYSRKPNKQNSRSSWGLQSCAMYLCLWATCSRPKKKKKFYPPVPQIMAPTLVIAKILNKLDKPCSEAAYSPIVWFTHARLMTIWHKGKGLKEQDNMTQGKRFEGMRTIPS